MDICSITFYSKARKHVNTLENTKSHFAGEVFLIGCFPPNLATLESVNLIVGFTIVCAGMGRKLESLRYNKSVQVIVDFIIKYPSIK